MKSFTLIILVILVGIQPLWSASEVEKLIEILKATAAPGSGIPASISGNIVEKLQALGAEAIPYLLPLLKEKNDDVRRLAAYSLRDIKGLTEENLDLLIESQREHDDWLPPAIARIGTPKAVDFIVQEFIRKRESGNPVTYAVEILGKKAVPGLVHAFEDEKGWDVRLEDAMCRTFHELGGNAREAIEPLLKISIDQTASVKKRCRAIKTLGAIGSSAERAVHDLQMLRTDKNEDIRSDASLAIRNIGSAEAVPIVLEILERSKDNEWEKSMRIQELAQLKTNGRSAGPTLVKYLSDASWDARVGAALALGQTGYAEGIDDLTKLLGREDDWRLVWSAADSLGRLKAASALSDLSRVSEHHWHPPVRDAAAKAIRAIKEGAVPAENEPVASAFFMGQIGGDMEMIKSEEATLIRFPAAKVSDQKIPDDIKAAAGESPFGEPIGVSVDGGYLVGIDKGEFGGSISFIDLKDGSQLIVNENPQAIYKIPKSIVAIAGLAHLFGNQGMIYKLAKSANGRWTAEKWRSLPGAPRISRLLQDGRILISGEGGIVLVSPDGEIKSLTRGEALRP